MSHILKEKKKTMKKTIDTLSKDPLYKSTVSILKLAYPIVHRAEQEALKAEKIGAGWQTYPSQSVFGEISYRMATAIQQNFQENEVFEMVDVRNRAPDAYPKVFGSKTKPDNNKARATLRGLVKRGFLDQRQGIDGIEYRMTQVGKNRISTQKAARTRSRQSRQKGNCINDLIRNGQK